MNWFTSMFTGESGPGDAVSASTMNVTKIVSIVVALFAGLTTALEKMDTISLSSGQMVTIWLTVGGMITLVGITDMVCRSYVTAHTAIHEKVIDPPISVMVKNGVKHKEKAHLLKIYEDAAMPFGIVEYDDTKQKSRVLLSEVSAN